MAEDVAVPAAPQGSAQDASQDAAATGSVARAAARAAFLVVLAVVLVVPMVFDPNRDEVFAPAKLTALHVLIGLGLVALAVTLLTGGGARVPALRLADGAVAVFAVLQVLAYLHSVNRTASLRGLFPEYQGLTTMLGYVAVYGLARLTVTSRRRLAGLLAVLTGTTAGVGGYALAQRAGLDPLWGSATRPFGTIGQPNSLAAMLVVGVPAAVVTTLRARGPARWAAAVAAGIGALALLVSLSRGGWLGLLAAVVAALLTLPRARRRRALVTVGVGVVAAGVALGATAAGRGIAADAGVRATAVSRTGSGSVAAHLALFEIGVGLTAQNPLLGLGQDVFPKRAQRYADAHLPKARADLLRPYTPESPHNALLSLSVASGVPSLLAYLVLLGAVGRVTLRAARRGDLLAGAVFALGVGHLVTDLFMTPEVSSSAVFWVVLGAAASALTAPDPGADAPLAEA